MKVISLEPNDTLIFEVYGHNSLSFVDGWPSEERVPPIRRICTTLANFVRYCKLNRMARQESYA